MEQRNSAIPNSLTPEILGQWLVEHAIEKFTDTKKIYYSQEELSEFKDRSVSAGIEIKNLRAQKKLFAAYIERGTEEHMVMEIPSTKGIKMLQANREHFEAKVEAGFFTETVHLYGIPNSDTQTMDFFDIEGNEILERKRSLSAKEVREHIGLFAKDLNSKTA